MKKSLNSVLLMNIVCILLASLATELLADAESKPENNPEKIIAGWVERVTIPEVKINANAKLDTGAQTSSIHAENIREFEIADQKWVRFDLVSENEGDKIKHITLEKPLQRKVKIKEHGGTHDRRVVVELEICFNGRVYLTAFTLANRKNYVYPIILGREFLKGVAIVDSEKTFQALRVCEMIPPG